MSHTRDPPAHGVTEKDLNLHLGQSIYVKDPEEAWREGTVFELKGSQVTTKDGKGQIKKQSASEVRLRGESSLWHIEDLTQLAPLNEATVLECLAQRFRKKIYYTRAGCTIVAVNPFQDVSHLYSLRNMQKYRARQQGLPPHIYHIADQAYWRLKKDIDSLDQSIVVSGESGAGKTVSAKHMLRYITTVASNEYDSARLDTSSGTAGEVEKKIIDCNPILEAFGNAATPRNENSSRFGKFTDLQFERGGIVRGAAIQIFLLEKTRVPHQGREECNFHIFYQLAQGIAEVEQLPENLQSLVTELSSVEFRIIPPSPEMDENRSLLVTVEALMELGLEQDRLLGLLQVIAAILYLGNVDFKRNPRNEDASLHDPSGDGQHSPDFFVELTASGPGLEGAARMLGVRREELEQVLLHRHISPGSKARRSVCQSPTSPREASSRRDCLGMLLYARLFDWLVKYINEQITADSPSQAIGLLDIYGFEVLEENSLEQLCINYANERLQQHFTRHILHNLQKEYEEEKVRWKHISYRDNEASLQLLEGKACTFELLNEQVYLGRAVNDRQLAETLQGMIKKESGSGGPSTLHDGFIIQHYAGPVLYLTKDLVTKNKDNVPAELVTLLQKAQHPFIQAMFADFQAQQGQGRKMKTVLTKFKSSLDELMGTLEGRQVHYIRCIKPNPRNKAGLVQRPYCLTQLEACGIIEATHITRHGYAARFDYQAFQQRYGLILRQRTEGDLTAWTEQADGDDDVDEDKENEDICNLQEQHLRQQLELPATPSTPARKKRRQRRQSGLSSNAHSQRCCAAILETALGPGCLDQDSLRSQFGLSKLFLSQKQLEVLEEARAVQLSRLAAVVQRAWRRHQFRQLLHQFGQWVEARLAVRAAWKTWRRRVALEKFSRLRQGRVVQAVWEAWRLHLQRERERYSAAVTIQSAVRRWLYRKAVRDAGVFDSMDAGNSNSSITTLTDSETLLVSPREELPSSKDAVDSSVLPADQRTSPSKNSEDVKVQGTVSPRADLSPDRPRLQQGSEDSSLLTPPGVQRLGNNEDDLLLDMEAVRNGLSGSDGCLSQDSGVLDPDYLSGSPSTERSPEPPARPNLCSAFRRALFLSNGESIVSRRVTMPVRFHTRKLCLPHAHLPPRVHLGMQDCLSPELPSAEDAIPLHISFWDRGKEGHGLTAKFIKYAK